MPASKKKVTLHINKIEDGTYAAYTEKEMSDLIHDGTFDDGEKFWEITLEGKPKTLSVGQWELK